MYAKCLKSNLLLAFTVSLHLLPIHSKAAERSLNGTGLRELQSQLQDKSVSRTIVLEPAGQLVLSALGIRSYSEGTRGIIDVRLTKDGEHFVLVGQSVGETTLLFLKDDGSEEYVRVRVQEAQNNQQKSVHVERNENIRLDFYFVQFDRARSHQVGLGYADSVSMGSFSAEFDFLSKSFQSASALVENQALLRLDMAEAQGHARLLRKAALITENGKLAEFTGGGEVNIPVQGSLTTGIHRISFGSTIKVLPIFDPESHRMQIEISAEVADLTDDRGSGAPGRLRSTLATVVNVAQGQAIALAGLSAQNDLRSRKGLPLLSRIPILGALFGSQRMSKQQTDLVIFILPSVVEQAQFSNREEIGQALQTYRKYHGKRSTHQELLEHFEFINADQTQKKRALTVYRPETESGPEPEAEAEPESKPKSKPKSKSKSKPRSSSQRDRSQPAREKKAGEWTSLRSGAGEQP